MGKEGQKAPRDVASKESKHPWEVFPEEENVRIEKFNKAQESKKKRKESLDKSKSWVKTHKKLLLGVVILVLIIAIALVVFLIVNQKKRADEGLASGDSDLSLIDQDDENVTFENAETPDVAYPVAMRTFKAAALDNAFIDGRVDRSIVKDNVRNFLKEQKTEYYRTLYQIIAVVEFSLFEEESSARYYLDEAEKNDVSKFDEKTEYCYFIAKRIYGRTFNDQTMFETYDQLIREKYVDKESQIVENGGEEGGEQ